MYKRQDNDYATASNALKRYLARELAVYQGLGFELPDAYQGLAAEDASQADGQRVQKLADNKWIGDLLLALVDMYGEETSESLTNGRIITLLAALRQAGLNDEAENLAVEVLLHAAGRLSLADPRLCCHRLRAERNWCCHERRQRRVKRRIRRSEFGSFS